MNRAQRILTHGWMGNALNVLTFGYYPFYDVATGKLCTTIGMTIPGTTIAMTIPGTTIAMTIPGTTVSMTIPGTTIELEDCT